ncbi:MAG: hypothetical protein ACI85I_002781, partial [Arenicella sp.]
TRIYLFPVPYLFKYSEQSTEMEKEVGVQISNLFQ